MAYELIWIIPSRVLLIELENVLSAEETLRVIDECNQYVSIGLSPVHILIDASNISNTRIDFQEITQLSKFMKNEDIGWWILINPTKMIGFTASVIAKMLQKKMKVANSVQEAVRILERVDFTLDAHQTLPVAN